MSPVKRGATPGPAFRSAAHRAIAEREAKIAADAIERRVDPYPLICADRRARWAKTPAVAKASADFREWAQRMTARYGSTAVRIGHVELGWIEALLVARYGEAEDYWPTALTPEDAERAGQWYVGAWVPEGVKFAAGASGSFRARSS
jgi:hypothetical protein